MKYSLAIFDMDGTILNTLDDMTDSLNVILEKYKLPLHTLDEVRFMVGNGIPKLIERAIPQGRVFPTTRSTVQLRLLLMQVFPSALRLSVLPELKLL